MTDHPIRNRELGARSRRWAGPLLAGAMLSGLAAAPALAAPDAETAYIFNTLLFLMGGFLVMWMAAGFAMLEVGFVRTKHASVICMKNIGLYSLAGLMYFLVGYNLMYTGVDGGWMGSFGFWAPGQTAAAETIDISDGYAPASDWFFQMVFVATAASIVSGAVAERVRLFPFFVFVIVLTGFIYPIQGAWDWGEGWLETRGFSDFAGSTLVHSTGGWAALTGVLLLGPRAGRFIGGKAQNMPGSSLPLATLGTFILWMGWFGFNGGSQLALGTPTDAVAVSQVFANTNMAAVGGVCAAILMGLAVNKGKPNLTFALNGALAGLVSITAEPLTPTLGQAVLIGAVGGIIATFGALALERFGVDDVVGAIPVHLFAGIWGTLIVPATNPSADFLVQLLGVVSIGAFVVAASGATWLALKYTVGIRLSADAEAQGGDLAELGHEAYPEFAPANGR